jgi:hypothetical protein
MGLRVEALSNKNAGFESHLLRLLSRRRRRVRLRMDKCVVHGLRSQARLASIPHETGKKTEIGRWKRTPIYGHEPGRWCRQHRAMVRIVD